MAEAQAPAKKNDLTAGEAAKMVRRPVTSAVMKDGAPVRDKDNNVVTRTDHVAVAAGEVLSFKEYEDGKVVVVTKDGKKFSNRGDE